MAEMDALLAEVGATPSATAGAESTAAADSNAAAATSNPVPAVAAEGDRDDADGGVPLEDRDPATLSKGQKKKLAERRKAAAAKAAAAEGDVGDAAASAAAGGGGDGAKGKKGAPKPSAAALAAAAAVEKRRLQEEAAAAAEAERIAREAAEAEAERLEEERREAERLARAEAKRAERERLRKEGKLLTGAAKAKADRMAAMRAQMGLAGGAGGDDDVASGSAAAPRETARERAARLAEEKRARDAAAAANRERARAAAEAAEAAELAAEREREREKKRAVEETRAAREAAAAAAAAAEESASADDAWDASSSDGEGREKGSGSGSGSSSSSSSSGSGSGSSSSSSGSDDSSDYTSSSDDSSASSSSSEEDADDARRRAARLRRLERRRNAMTNRSAEDLRSPICCVLGHVDTGKTKILDHIRRTSVQEGEAGGITQQIGATYIPKSAVEEKTAELFREMDERFERGEVSKRDRWRPMRVPGLLVIDTPGHESFSNLRSRGSGLCDIAVLVVDIMHGLEPQTRESIRLLKLRKTPFLIALNKIDRLYGWQDRADAPARRALESQASHTQEEFRRRFDGVALQLNEEGLNVAVWWENPDPRRYANVVPTSALTGEGLPDLMGLLVRLTQEFMGERLMYCDETQATVLDVRKIEGLGPTIDIVLVNGRLREGQRIVACGLHGAICTNIRALLTPQPMRELRVKSAYVHHKEIRAAQGLKVAAPGLETAVAGTELYVVDEGDDEEELCRQVESERDTILTRVSKQEEGVCVQASTLGSMEALLEFLGSDDVKVPVSGVSLGPIHKKDVLRASTVARTRPDLAVILAFDVPVSKDILDFAAENHVTIFVADIIYHLFDQFKAYQERKKEERKAAAADEAVFPCRLKILEQYVFNKADPLVCGVEVVEGTLRRGTPICVPAKGALMLGKVTSIEKEKREVFQARRGEQVAIKVQPGGPAEATKAYGRHYDAKDELVSRVSRNSIDLLKENFRDSVEPEDWKLMVKLKKVFGID